MKVIIVKTFFLLYNKFTGVIIENNETISFFKNGKYHRKNGPAYISSESVEWHANGLVHRECGPAIIWQDGRKYWWFKENCYGIDNDFNIETWKEKVKELKREEKLKIFI